MEIMQLTAKELQERLTHNDPMVLLDVRESHEYHYARIENSVLIPLNQIPSRVNELNPSEQIVLICHHGMRSQQAANFLAKSGFQKVANLVGGIDAWSQDCDASVPRY
jgi:rhodanese-related sulfurtransferase